MGISGEVLKLIVNIMELQFKLLEQRNFIEAMKENITKDQYEEYKKAIDVLSLFNNDMMQLYDAQEVHVK
jgi:hypothetical protein